MRKATGVRSIWLCKSRTWFTHSSNVSIMPHSCAVEFWNNTSLCFIYFSIMHHSEGFVDLGPATCNQSVLNVLSRKIGVWVILLCGLSCLQCPHVGQIDQIDHDLDHPDPNLAFWGVVQDLFSTDPTQETCPPSCRLFDAHLETWELDDTDQGSICPERSSSSTGDRWSVPRVLKFHPLSKWTYFLEGKCTWK